MKRSTLVTIDNLVKGKVDVDATVEVMEDSSGIHIGTLGGKT